MKKSSQNRIFLLIGVFCIFFSATSSFLTLDLNSFKSENSYCKSKITSSSNNLPIPLNINDGLDLSIENESFDGEKVDFFKEYISFYSNKISSFNYVKLNKLFFKKTSLVLVNHLPLFIQFQDFRI
ncbi:MAG: hypothetical protein EB087_03085 [Flavobacteriales bacterium]|nr:hypothetical protein [Flavobacteriales bacterium]